jgi:pyridoxine 5-phosphate synthase
MIRLGVNIDHVATLRQARRALEPDPLAAAVLALLGGADGITVHLREDRRHINDRDVRLLRQVVTSLLNLELSVAEAIVSIACDVKPDQATLVPERREELTTEGGLDVVQHQGAVAKAMERLQTAGIAVALFIDPDIRQIEIAKVLSAKAV